MPKNFNAEHGGGILLVRKILVPVFLTIIMVISRPTNPIFQQISESSDHCCINISSDQNKPAVPFRQPINPQSLQVIYGLAPRLDVESSEDDGGEPDEKKGGGGHQTQLEKPRFHII
ncbi:MAG: hypothetical protein EOM23_04725 [Candidatus Moranbacteria bacterium]|nr:hypothetical protein [Candidatus Moranbacteria bacterium]